MTTEFDNEDDPYLRPHQPDLEDEPDFEDEDEELAVDLEEAAAEFRMLYYGRTTTRSRRQRWLSWPPTSCGWWMP